MRQRWSDAEENWRSEGHLPSIGTLYAFRARFTIGNEIENFLCID